MAGKGTIGVKLVLEGESSYRTALKNIKSAQSELRSEMKLCASEFKTSQNSVEALRAKYDVLTKQVDTSQKKYDVYNKALSEAKSKQKELGTSLNEAKSKYEAASKAMEELEKSGSATNEELEEQKKKVADCAQEVSDAQSKYDACSKKVYDYQTSLNYAGAELAEFKNDQEQTGKYLEEAKNSLNNCAKSIDEYGKEVQEASSETASFGTVLSANLASEAIIAGVEKLVSGIKTIASACIDTGMAFEKSMSTVAALSGATGDDLEALTEKAREMGAATLYSAADAADALGYMALAGWNTQQMLEGIEPVMNLAIASDMDLAEASDIVTDNITAFGLTVADSSKFVDEMAYAMSNSNTNTEQLGEAYKNCAAAAGSMGYSVEDVTAALMVMANAGQKGGEAGNGLKTIMTRLATDTKNCAQELAKYGVEVYDAEGNMNSLSSILLGCGEIWEGLTDEQQNNLAVVIAGQNQFNKFQTIMMGMNDAAKESGKSFADYTKQLEECDGAAAEMAAIMSDNLQGAIWNLESGLEAVEETAYSALSESMKNGVNEASDALTRLNDSLKYGDAQVSLKNLGTAFENLVENSADLIEDVLPSLIDGLSWIINNAGALTGLIGGITGGVTAYTIATQAAEAATALFNGTLALNPIGAVAAAIVAATSALVIWNATAEKSESEKLADDMDNLRSSLEATKQAREDDRKEMEVSASTCKSLVKELEDETTSQRRKKQIVEELNQAMPDLNLLYDEQTDSLNMTTDALLENIDALMKQQRLQAAQEDLNEIAQEQYEIQKRQNELMDEAAEKYGIEAETVDEAAEALREMAENQEETNNQTTLYTGMETGYEQNAEDIRAMAEAMDGTIETMDGLIDEADQVGEYIDQNTEKIDESTDAINENADAMTNAGATAEEVSEEIIDAFDDAKEDLAKSFSSMTEDFQNLGQEALGLKETTVTSFADIKQQMDEWAAGVDSYADSVAVAEMIMDGDSNTRAYLQSIIDKGPSAASELDAVTDAYYENNDAFNEMVDTYTKTNDVLDALANLEAGMSTGYTDAYQAGLDAIIANAPDLTEEMQSNFNDQVNAVEQGTADVQNAMTEGYSSGASDQASAMAETTETVAQEGILDPLNETLGTDGTTSTETTTVGENVDQGLIDGVENLEEDVNETATTLATDTYDTINENLSEDKFETIGEQICSGLKSGLEKGASSVTSMARQVARDAYNASKRELDVNSPSKKYRWLGEMSGEGFTEGLVDSMANIDAVVANATEGAAKAASDVAGANGIYSKTANNATYGGVNITVYGAEGQNVNDLANIVMDKINNQFVRTRAAFG